MLAALQPARPDRTPSRHHDVLDLALETLVDERLVAAERRHRRLVRTVVALPLVLVGLATLLLAL